MAAESASVSSVRLPIPISISVPGNCRRTSKYRPRLAANPHPIGSRTRIDSQRYIPRSEQLDGFLQAGQRIELIGNDDDFTSPVKCRLTVGLIHGKNEFGACSHGGFDFGRVQAIDGNTMSLITESSHARGNSRPSVARIATYVDHVGTVIRQPPGFGKYFVEPLPRRMIDFGNDFYIVVAVFLGGRVRLSEEIGQLSQVARPTFDFFWVAWATGDRSP